MCAGKGLGAFDGFATAAGCIPVAASEASRALERDGLLLCAGNGAFPLPECAGVGEARWL